MPSKIHHPAVLRHGDGRWVVRCPECQQTQVVEVLIGIGAPVQSEHEAQMMRDNHSRSRGRTTR